MSKERVFTPRRPQDADDSLDAKRRLLAAMDDWRGDGPEPSAPADPASAGEAARPDEVGRLKARLEAAELARGLLEGEIRQLERRALAAIAEASRLRRSIDEAASRPDPRGLEEGWLRERRELRHDLEAARLERALLTSALSDSEAELSRMARAIDLMSRRLDVAG